MSVGEGSRWGPYEILGKIGEGGMGEVYRARDTRLGRMVAIKTVAQGLQADSEARRRFEREARAVASLNHPHICALYDVGCQDGTDFLVMEQLEGETLASRLLRGPFEPGEAVRLAGEIAGGLAAAHRRGVCHRDIKPANIMLTKGGVKILDFGLARVDSTGDKSVVTGNTPTAPVTIAGTVPYMAPEQLAGGETGPLSDIFALGAVLYEMIAGRRAFEGEARASVIAAIMASRPPPLSEQQPAVPPALEQIVTRCLAKEPEERWQNAQDLADALHWVVAPAIRSSAARAAPKKPETREIIAWAAIAVLLAAGIGAFALRPQVTGPSAAPARFRLPLPDNVVLRSFDFPLVSPDGSQVAFGGISRGAGTSGIWVRPLASLGTRQLLAGSQPLADTTTAFVFPFWSPDGRSMAFFGDGKLMRVDLAGGAPVKLCDYRLGRGGAWGKQDVILFAESGGRPIQSIPAIGGESKPVTIVEHSRGERDHSWPQFLPDGNRFLYYVSGPREVRGIYAGSLDSSIGKTRVAEVDINGIYARGHLLFLRGSALMMQPFDAGRLRATGDPVALAEPVARISGAVSTGGAGFSASEGGPLAYVEGGPKSTELAWYDRRGRKLRTLGEAADYSNPVLSRDGASLAVGLRDPRTDARDIYVFDAQRGVSARATFDSADDLNPVWSPDGKRIAFTSTRKGGRDLYSTASDGSGKEELLLASPEEKNLEDWSADGKWLLFNDGPGHLQALRLSDGVVAPLTSGPGIQVEGRVSPNSRWLAYRLVDAGRSEIFVESFPPGAGRWQISTHGGAEPAWRADGKELFFVVGNKLMSVDTETGGPTFKAGAPRELFAVEALSGQFRNRYVPSPDGQSFLFVLQMDTGSNRSFVVVLNWSGSAPKRY